ncbi:recombination protein NinG [Pseudomonas tolaasii]|uniref:recombination protein NinG n=1 Tax=Pseudomonas tolaasii TaxID=29442 RepID=UPI00159FDDE7|nr:recombination protein NinG [Pseudomonas tolaasii]NWC26862.1 recombination protein NinG [Pseudomonas tolaasii]NWC51015.1 recombination protein NinG [Pseudomonas tolaasii]NWE62611.1 recombination protein NinG [Pseudomonas tolaasii]
MAIERKPTKPKKCRVATCRASFVPSRLGQAVCSPACAMIDAPRHEPKARKALAEIGRKELRAAKVKIKTRAQHMKEAQAAFNAWIRERDIGLPCVSCGRHHNGQWHAGHYRTVGGNPELRFEPLNVWRQCAPCNNHKSGDIVNYRLELVRRIGADKVDWLEGPHEPQRHTIEQLQAIKAKYRAMTRELKKGEAA